MGVVIPERDSAGNPIGHVEAFPVSDKWKFAGRGSLFTCAKNSVTNNYRVISSKQAFNGIAILLHNHERGDTMDLIIESDGSVSETYGPAGTALNNFGLNWNVDWERAYQDQIVLPYRGTLVPGMRINIRYNSVGTTNDINLYANYFLHDEL